MFSMAALYHRGKLTAKPKILYGPFGKSLLTLLLGGELTNIIFKNRLAEIGFSNANDT